MAYGNNTGHLVVLGGGDSSVTKVSDNLNSAFTYETGGDAVFLHFISPVTQSSGNLTVYVFCNAVTGSPTDIRCALYNGAGTASDKDRPESGGSEVAVSGATDFSGTAGTWVSFSLTGVSLTKHTDYFIVVDNRTGTPTSHHIDIVRKSGNSSVLVLTARLWQGGFTTDGFTSDPALGSGPAPWVLKFGSGLIAGFPYTENQSYTASSYTYWGNRFAPTEDIRVNGCYALSASTIWDSAGIWKSDGTLVVQDSVDVDWKFGIFPAITRFDAVTLTGGTEYDVLFRRASAGTSIGATNYMGETSPPVDISGLAFMILVHGTAVGASLTEVSNRTNAMGVLIHDNPAIVGGGGVIRRIPKIIGA